jgi:signal transduction histidine kinase
VLVAKKEKVYLASALTKSITTHEAQIKSHAIQIHNTIPLEAVVWVDNLLLEMIIDNLISNAIKYNKTSGSIFITWDAPKRILSIADEGIGIDADQLPLLFNRFYRADDSRSSKIPGNGLGLAITKLLCDAQHIKLSVSSIKSKGTTFLLQFPA